MDGQHDHSCLCEVYLRSVALETFIALGDRFRVQLHSKRSIWYQVKLFVAS